MWPLCCAKSGHTWVLFVFRELRSGQANKLYLHTGGSTALPGQVIFIWIFLVISSERLQERVVRGNKLKRGKSAVTIAYFPGNSISSNRSSFPITMSSSETFTHVPKFEDRLPYCLQFPASLYLLVGLLAVLKFFCKQRCWPYVISPNLEESRFSSFSLNVDNTDH